MSAETVASTGDSVTYRRTASKPHRCGCGRRIPAGDVYLEHVAFPGHDALGWGATRPWRLRECASCAHRYGRDYELGDVSFAQCARDGLL